MPEYLSPGVYVEEYESGAVPMEGVGTSTAGFVGLAEKGDVIGKPQLVTSFSDYVRIFGGYLSETKYGAGAVHECAHQRRLQGFCYESLPG